MRNLARFCRVSAAISCVIGGINNPILAQSPGDTMGITQQDYQSNASAGQRIAVDDSGGVHVVWMGGDYPGPRGIYYNYIDPYGNILYPEGAFISSGGYPQIAVNSQNQPGIVFHGLDSLIYWTPSGQYRPPSNGYWPALSIDQRDWVHLIFGSGQGQMELRYLRSNNGGPNWTTPAIVDTVTIPSYTITSSPVSNKVAIAYLHPYDSSSQFYNDVYYIQSLNGVSWDWQDGKVNITNYDFGGLSAWPDLDAVYDYNDNLHIIWNVARMSDSLVTEFLFHYDVASQAITEIVQIDAWLQPGCDWGTWNLPAGKMSIASAPDNTLAIIYTRFNEDDCSAGGFANGEIYLQHSTDGSEWSTPYSVTYSHTPNCMAGFCDSDHWPSAAERIDASLHIFYVNDKDAGGIPQTEGSVTDNPMLYYNVPVDLLGVPEGIAVPGDFSLSQNYPNPFNARTSISFELRKDAFINLSVYDIKGSRIQILANRRYAAGGHEITFDAGRLTSGIYFFRLISGDDSQCRRMILIK